jgi:hypothetical protein
MIPCRRFHRFGEGATEYITIAEFALFGDRQLEAEVRWAVADRDAAAEAARGRERQAEEGGRRSEPRQGDASGRPPPKTLRPVRKRKLVDAVCGEWDVSIIGWACRRRRAEPSVAPALSMPDRLSEAPSVTVACGVLLLSRKPLYPVATSLWTIPT